MEGKPRMENEAQQNQCIRCGAKIEPGADNCPYCGAGQREGIPPLPGTEAAGVVEAKKRPTAAIVVAIILIVLALLSLAGAGVSALSGHMLTNDDPQFAEAKRQMVEGLQRNPMLEGKSEAEMAGFFASQVPWLAGFGVGYLVFGIALFWGKKWASRGAAAVSLIAVILAVWSIGDAGPMALVNAIVPLALAIYLIAVDKIFL
jgi:ribosomal protein L40E